MFRKTILKGKKVYYKYKLEKIKRGIWGFYVLMGISIFFFCFQFTGAGSVFLILSVIGIIITQNNKAEIIRRIEELDTKSSN